jgi:hypothetical protein
LETTKENQSGLNHRRSAADAVEVEDDCIAYSAYRLDSLDEEYQDIEAHLLDVSE